MKVGLIGTGRMAANRAKYVIESDDHELSWVCSRDESRARKAMAEWDADKAAEPVTSLEAGLERRPVDAVIDTSPNALHREHAETVFQAGCHLLVEYPHACTVEDGRRMIEAATRAGKTMHVGLTHRFGASHEFYAALFAPQSQSPVDVDLGRPYSYSEVMCSGNPISRWFDNDRLSGGMFVASMYHFIDEARSFFGDPRAIRASYDSTRDGSGRILHDTGHALLSFDGPTVVNIAYSRGFRKPGLGSRRLVVFENGYLEQSAKGSVVRNPDGEKQITVPSDDAMSKDTSHFFETIGRSNETPEWAQASLQIACSLQEDAGLTAGPRRD